MINQNMTHFIHNQKQKQLLLNVTLMTYLNQSLLQLYQTYKTFKEKVQAGLLIQSSDHNINVPRYHILVGSSYIKLPKQFDHPRKNLINVQNIDYN